MKFDRKKIEELQRKAQKLIECSNDDKKCLVRVRRVGLVFYNQLREHNTPVAQDLAERVNAILENECKSEAKTCATALAAIGKELPRILEQKKEVTAVRKFVGPKSAKVVENKSKLGPLEAAVQDIASGSSKLLSSLNARTRRKVIKRAEQGVALQAARAKMMDRVWRQVTAAQKRMGKISDDFLDATLDVTGKAVAQGLGKLIDRIPESWEEKGKIPESWEDEDIEVSPAIADALKKAGLRIAQNERKSVKTDESCIYVPLLGADGKVDMVRPRQNKIIPMHVGNELVCFDAKNLLRYADAVTGGKGVKDLLMTPARLGMVPNPLSMEEITDAIAEGEFDHRDYEGTYLDARLLFAANELVLANRKLEEEFQTLSDADTKQVVKMLKALVPENTEAANYFEDVDEVRGQELSSTTNALLTALGALGGIALGGLAGAAVGPLFLSGWGAYLAGVAATGAVTGVAGGDNGPTNAKTNGRPAYTRIAASLVRLASCVSVKLVMMQSIVGKEDFGDVVGGMTALINDTLMNFIGEGITRMVRYLYNVIDPSKGPLTILKNLAAALGSIQAVTENVIAYGAKQLGVDTRDSETQGWLSWIARLVTTIARLTGRAASLISPFTYQEAVVNAFAPVIRGGLAPFTGWLQAGMITSFATWFVSDGALKDSVQMHSNSVTVFLMGTYGGRAAELPLGEGMVWSRRLLRFWQERDVDNREAVSLFSTGDHVNYWSTWFTSMLGFKSDQQQQMREQALAFLRNFELLKPFLGKKGQGLASIPTSLLYGNTVKAEVGKIPNDTRVQIEQGEGMTLGRLWWLGLMDGDFASISALAGLFRSQSLILNFTESLLVGLGGSKKLLRQRMRKARGGLKMVLTGSYAIGMAIQTAADVVVIMNSGGDSYKSFVSSCGLTQGQGFGLQSSMPTDPDPEKFKEWAEMQWKNRKNSFFASKDHVFEKMEKQSAESKLETSQEGIATVGTGNVRLELDGGPVQEDDNAEAWLFNWLRKKIGFGGGSSFRFVML